MCESRHHRGGAPLLRSVYFLTPSASTSFYVAELTLFLLWPRRYAALFHGVLVTAGATVVEGLFQRDGLAGFLFLVVN